MKKVALIVIGIAALLLSSCSTSNYFVKRSGKTISFYAIIPKAKIVYFVSNLTNFRKVKTKKTNKNLWKTSLPYRQGIVRYFYIVDGKVFIPPCKTTQRDDFGGRDCVYVPNL